MQTVRILQAVALMLIVALAASCAATKEYTGKLFAPKTPSVKDSQGVALRFLDTGENDMNTSDWVSTDVIMGRDTSNSTTILDNFTKSLPTVTAPAAVKPKSDSLLDKETRPVIIAKAPVTTDEPVARSGNAGSTRQKKTREE